MPFVKEYFHENACAYKRIHRIFSVMQQDIFYDVSGVIFYVLQHFTKKIRNFTNFRKLFIVSYLIFFQNFVYNAIGLLTTKK